MPLEVEMCIRDRPDSDWDSIGQAFFSMIAGAKSKVYIVTPYLMPPREIVYALKTAAMRSVDVRILIPHRETMQQRWHLLQKCEAFRHM